jgi:hypothetical protein
MALHAFPRWPTTCQCGDERVFHLHYRAGTDCSSPGCRCVRFRPFLRAGPRQDEMPFPLPDNVTLLRRRGPF